MIHAAKFAGEALLWLYLAPLLLNLLKLVLTRHPLLLREDRSRDGLVPPPAEPAARVRICFTRGRSLRSIFGGHSFLVYKDKNASKYVRYEWDERGEPIRNEGFIEHEPGAGAPPGFIYAADGWHAEQLIPWIEKSVAAYAKRHVHDYRRFPGPNSNTFMQGVIDGVPAMDAVLSPLAIGKDYPHDGKLIRRLHSGILISLGGLFAIRLGWIEGVELSLFGLVAGLDWRRPAIKIPSIGRIGLPACPAPPRTPGSGRVMRAEQLAQMEERRAARGTRDFGDGPVIMGAGRRGRGRR